MLAEVDAILPYGFRGRVTDVRGLAACASGLPAPIGALCEIGGGVTAEVVGFREDQSVLFPYGTLTGVRRGDEVRLTKSTQTVAVGEALLGRVVDGFGRPLDGLTPPLVPHRRPLVGEPTPALSRPPIDAPLPTGVRAVDGLLTLGRGQRVGVFAGSGVGKSTLLGQLARGAAADVNVVVLVGERGREVREFLEKDLGKEGLAKSVVVVATSEEPALMRLRAAEFGTAVAEFFRDAGRDVLLMMDSVTRYALAQREVALAAGEPPATRGYPPSVFARLPRLLERSGRTQAGSITGVYTVLVEGDDTNEPVSDAVRGILDGHVVLSRKLAERNHWPAVDVLGSVSRVMPSLIDESHRDAAAALRRMLAVYRDGEDLISIGAYQPGGNPALDQAVQRREAALALLQQRPDEFTSAEDTRRLLTAVAS